MNKKQIKRTIFGLIVLGCVGFYFWNTVSMDIHYKLTINVQTPEGIVSGTTVREVKNTALKKKIEVLPGQGNPANIRGEAVVVDLGERGVFFGLMSNDLYSGFPTIGASTYKGLQYFNSLDVGDKRDIPKKHWPQMVTFTDINDAKTVTRVLQTGYCDWPSYRDKKCPVNEGPYEVENNLESTFGKGVSIKSVTVEITDDKVTAGIVDNYLNWLSNVGGGYLDGKFIGGGPELSNILHSGNFKKGE